MTYQNAIFGGGASRLGVDTDWPSDKTSASTVTRTIQAIDASSGPVNAFASDVIVGPGEFNYMELSGLTDSELLTITLIVDGVTVWNKQITQVGTTHLLMGENPSTSLERWAFNSTWVLNLTTAVDADIDLAYMWRPTL